MKEIHCYHFDTEIIAGIDVVFECLNKDEHVLKWNSQIVENRYDGNEDDLTVGSTYTTVQKVGKKIYELEAKCTKYDPPYNAAVETETKEGVSKTEYKLIETEEGTKFIVDVYFVPSNWIYHISMKMLKWSFKYLYDEQFEAFVNYIYELEAEQDAK